MSKILKTSKNNLPLGIDFSQVNTEKTVLIQISDPASRFATHNSKFKEEHQFEFLDLDEKHTSLLSQMGEFCITEQQSFEIVKILLEAKALENNVLVQCYSGVYRSGAICKFAVDYLKFERGFNRSSDELFNTLVYKALESVYLKMTAKNETEERTPEDIQLLKEVWVLMLELGSVVHKDASHNYYGGGFHFSDALFYVSPEYKDGSSDHWQRLSKFKKRMKEEVEADKNLLAAKIVDWGKTSIPEYMCVSEFAGTGSPSDQVEIWDGKLVMTDGSWVRVIKTERNDELANRVEILNKLKKPAEAIDFEKLFKKHFKE